MQKLTSQQQDVVTKRGTAVTYVQVGASHRTNEPMSSSDQDRSPSGRLLNELMQAFSRMFWELDHQDRSEAAKRG